MPRAASALLSGLVLVGGCVGNVNTQAPAEASAPVVESAPPEPRPEPEPEPTDAQPEPDASEGPGEPSIDGESIRQIVRSQVPDIRACYELRPDLDPALAGRIEISFTIGPTGAVIEAKADAPESFPYPELRECIVDEMLTWTFPAPRDGGTVRVSYPSNGP